MYGSKDSYSSSKKDSNELLELELVVPSIPASTNSVTEADSLVSSTYLDRPLDSGLGVEGLSNSKEIGVLDRLCCIDSASFPDPYRANASECT